MIEPGDLIGIFEVLEIMPYRNKDHARLYRVRCVTCGFESIMKLQGIKRAKQCTHKNIAGKYIDFKTKSNPEDKTLIRILRGMRSRCYYKSDKSYKLYGGKGITICNEWLESPYSFVKWAWNNGYKDGLTIDRIDSSGPYSPENCRWVTLESNSRYKSTTNIYTVDGLSMTGREWSLFLGVGINMINRYARKYGEEETCNFIKWFLDHPEVKGNVNSHTSYYSIYQDAAS